jgi:hypothetical protein
MENYNWTPITNDEIKWVGVDFDETIANNSGYPDYIPAEPLKGAMESLLKLDQNGYKITIFTARPWVDYSNIEKYCEFYNIPARRIICGKPLFKCMIDDKGIGFRGDWDKTLEEVTNFK